MGDSSKSNGVNYFYTTVILTIGSGNPRHCFIISTFDVLTAILVEIKAF
jgi:hypothetical protein